MAGMGSQLEVDLRAHILDSLRLVAGVEAALAGHEASLVAAGRRLGIGWRDLAAARGVAPNTLRRRNDGQEDEDVPGRWMGVLRLPSVAVPPWDWDDFRRRHAAAYEPVTPRRPVYGSPEWWEQLSPEDRALVTAELERRRALMAGAGRPARPGGQRRQPRRRKS